MNADSNFTEKRLRAVTSEMKLAVRCALTIYVVLLYLTYSKVDPGWSQANVVPQLDNWGGRIGAWIADLTLFIFGISAWWFCISMVRSTWNAYKRLPHHFWPNKDLNSGSRQNPWVRAIGFWLLMIGSTGLDYTWVLSAGMELPREPGGVFGELVGGAAYNAFGLGGTLLLLLVFVIGFRMYFPLSWTSLRERIHDVVWVIEDIFFGQSPTSTNKNKADDAEPEQHFDDAASRRKQAKPEQHSDDAASQGEQAEPEQHSDDAASQGEQAEPEQHSDDAASQGEQAEPSSDNRTDEEIVGVKPGCTLEELKKAYREQCQRLHPDKWQSRPTHIREVMETEQKIVNAAYARLKGRFQSK